MALQLTAVFRKVPEGYSGFVDGLPGAKYARGDGRGTPIRDTVLHSEAAAGA